MTEPSAQIAPPSLGLLALEARSLGELGAHYLSLPLLRRLPRGDGHPVLVIPGLAAGDLSTRPLRRFLRSLGYSAHAWRCGRNNGRRGLDLQVMSRLQHLHTRYQQPVSLVGWSLGGLYAREIAKRSPASVRCVITLGSPFRGPADANNVWRLFELLSGRSNRHEPDRHPRFAEPPPVPTTAIYSRSDGIVAWPCCVERHGPKTESIAVASSHLGLGVHPMSLLAVADRLAQNPEHWKHFQRRGLRKWMFPEVAGVDQPGA